MISVYVGNLPYDTTEEQVVELFKQFGEVNRAALVKDRLRAMQDALGRCLRVAFLPRLHAPIAAPARSFLCNRLLTYIDPAT